MAEHGRLIDADALYEKTAEWEAQALHMVEVTMNDEDKTEWRRWTVILTERSAFKFDIADAPTIEPEPSQVAQDIATIIENEKDMRVIGERKSGKWTEREVFHEAESSTAIDEWQTARCSKCGKYHTTPYLYYFTDYDYCPHCGADMREE